MSIWQRMTESLAALARGERLSDVLERLTAKPEHTVGFAIAVIALGAKMAKADGRVTTNEVAAFRQIFRIPSGEEANAARIYNLARADVAGFDAYARQIARMFRDRQGVLADLYEGLVFIAVADGNLHPDEEAFLAEVARIFGITESQARSIRARHMPGESDPYQVLGVRPGISARDLRRQYRRLVRDLHPDPMIGRGVPHEAQKIAENRLAAINEAYRAVRAELGA